MVYLRIIFFAILIAAAPLTILAQGITKDSLLVEGKKRTYFLYVPASAKTSAPAPLLVLLHGSNRDGLSLVEKWKRLADAEGVILLGPNSADASVWSVPRDGPMALHELVEAIKSKYPINPRRVYLFGHSGGAGFALLMSLYESEYFAASAIHAGALDSRSLELTSLAKRKTPIYIQVGTVDLLFPLPDVRRTRDALVAKGFPVQLTEIPGHDHWYYDLAPKINEAAWQFLKEKELAADPHFEEYSFKGQNRSSDAAAEQYNKGVKLQQSGDLAGAIAAYTRAIKSDPNTADAYNNRGVAYLALKDYAPALADFSRSIELNPTSDAYNNRGNIYFSQKQFKAAISDFGESLKLKASAEAYTNRGTAYEESGEDTLGLADLDQAIRLDEKFARAYAVRGVISLKRSQDAAAQRDFDKAFQLDPALHGEFDPIIKQLRVKQ
ncbi:MAG: polyhydroxybutyrate depolymerase [Pyrinomonadaceae bacterium]|jgi:tetratricopeptide (TPR) repeat protein|nr:polyhydroxybutyrate depolymerase [Pyrinomonadaceae bacterium]